MNRVETINIKKFKVLENFEADIKGQNVLLVADNEQGKSSIIQFLQIAFGDQNHIPPDAMGEGFVIVDRDGLKYKLKVEIMDGKSKVKIFPPDGATPETSKGALKTLFGAIDFDIDEFVNLSKTKAGQKKQVEDYKKFLPQDIIEEIQKHKNKIKASEEERTQIGRDRDRIKALIDTNPLLGTNLDSYAAVDLTAVYQQLKEASTHNETVTKGESSLESVIKETDELEKQIAELMKKVEEKKKKRIEIEAWIKAHPKTDVSAFESQINNATEINKKHETAKKLKADVKEYEQLVEQYGELTTLIETSRQAVSDAIKDFDAPVDGLSFDEEKLLWNGIPVNPDSLSESQIMELGVLLKFAENPTLPLMLQRTESIGLKRWNDILAFAAEKDLQVIGEKVERGKEKLTIEFIADHQSKRGIGPIDPLM